MHVGEDLSAALAAAEARLRELESEREVAARELAGLRARQETWCEPEADPTGVDGTSSAAGWTVERKLRLFGDLFRGRTDVFPLRWENRAKDRSGWAPCCANEWRSGVCGKPRVKCGECPNQAFRALRENELLAHLQGRQVMGVYPMLADDTCWLLAIDLDGDAWRSDVAALRAVCGELGVVPAVERSRSGDGAHLWFFFSEPVPAALARRFGLMVLTEAMARNATLGMASYDRLFPSQDTLPRRGFGNLIALPLQREARAAGNTVFVDEQLQPFEDQWSYLGTLPRITPVRLRELTVSRGREARSHGMPDEPDPSIPWRPARTLTERLAETELPSTLSATIAQCVYVRDQNLPPALIDAMRRLAAFSNPRFLELQAMRMSTARTPRVISCFEQTCGYLVLPRGCRGELEKLLASLGVMLEMADERAEGERLDIEFTGALTALQDEAVSAPLGHDLGVVCAPPGIGKTVIASRLIAERGRSTLVLVHRKPLLEQWVKRLSEFLDLRPQDIGTIGGGRGRPTGVLDVAMVQSLARHHTRDKLLARYGHVVVDECHHVPAVTTERVLRSAPARYVTGLTATPTRRDGHHPIIKMQCGPVRHTIGGNASRLPHPFAQRVVRRETPFDPATLPPDPHIQEIFTALAADDARTEMVANDTLQLAAQGRRPLVLTRTTRAPGAARRSPRARRLHADHLAWRYEGGRTPRCARATR